jgi:hypothetical protein
MCAIVANKGEGKLLQLACKAGVLRAEKRELIALGKYPGLQAAQEAYRSARDKVENVQVSSKIEKDNADGTARRLILGIDSRTSAEAIEARLQLLEAYRGVHNTWLMARGDAQEAKDPALVEYCDSQIRQAADDVHEASKL